MKRHRIAILAYAVGATEAARFSLVRGGGELEIGIEEEHVRADNPPAGERKAAIAAFREMAKPCARQNVDGAIEIGSGAQANTKQYCLVLHRRQDEIAYEILTFIVRGRDLDEAKAKLSILRAVDGDGH